MKEALTMRSSQILNYETLFNPVVVLYVDKQILNAKLFRKHTVPAMTLQKYLTCLE